MATFKPKVVDASGSDALLDSTDNLEITAAPTADNHAANKLFVDTKVADEAAERVAADSALQDAIDAEAQTRADEDAALQEQINLITGDEPGTENPYVKRAGDDMSGDLTFNTDVILLDATDGSATFSGNILAGTSTTDYGVSAQNSASGNLWQAALTAKNFTPGGPVFAGLANNFAATAAGVTSVIYENGSANFRGPLDIFRGYDDRDGYAQKWGYFSSTTAGSERATVMVTAKGEYYATNSGDVGTGNYLVNISSSGTYHFGNSSDYIKYTQADGLYRVSGGTTVWHLKANGTATFTGLVDADISGNAATATNATNSTNSTNATNASYVYVERDDASNATRYITFVDDANAGNKRLNMDSGLTFNPTNNTLYSDNFTGTFNGNATSATDANNSQYLRGYAPSSSATVNTVVLRDGTGHIVGNYLQGTWVQATHGGDTASSLSHTVFRDSSGWYKHITYSDARAQLNVPTRTGGDASGTWGINITGSAGSAAKWSTARTITAGGDVSGSVSIDGSANKTFTMTVANDSHTHDGRYYTESESNGRYLYRLVNNWNESSEGYHRFYFASGGSTYIKCQNALYFRPNYADSDITYVSSGSYTGVTFNSTSDINLKKDIKVIENPIKKVKQLNGVEFVWKDSEQLSAGLIAQEVEKVLPQLVKEAENEEKYKILDYNGVIGLLVEAVKNQQEQIDELKKKLELN